MADGITGKSYTKSLNLINPNQPMKTNLIIMSFLGLTLLGCSTTAQLIENAKGEERTIQEMDAFFKGLLDTLDMPGLSVIVINDSQIAYQGTFGLVELGSAQSITRQTIFEAASLSKPVFAYFVLKQVEKGLLDLDKPLFDYLPYPDIAYDQRAQLITARMILSHSSGLPNWRSDSLKIEFEPGSKYMYSGEGYEYLTQVIAKVNGLEVSALDSLFQVEIAKPINAQQFHFRWKADFSELKATGHQNNQPTSREKDFKDIQCSSAGGLHTDARSYAQFLLSIFSNSILPNELMEEMLKQQVDLPDEDVNKLLIGATGWSLGFGIIPVNGKNCYFHGGNNEDFQSWMHFYPDQGYGVAVFSNSDKIQSPEFFDLFFDFINDGIRFDLDQLN